jgi:hypothetical protein
MRATYDPAAEPAAAVRRAEGAHGRYDDELGQADPNDERTGRSGPGGPEAST